MSADDEIDYMSEEFLAQCVGKSDCRPGLSHSHSTKRKAEIEKKKKNSDDTYRKRMRPISEIQKEKLKEALDTPIDPSNKGFLMLQKMGYKSGMSLGKQGTGIVEPVGVILKSDRIGLGWQELLKEKRRRREELRENRKVMDPLEYRAHKSNQHNQKLIESDLIKSRKACYNLDSKEGHLLPHEYWFWPEHTWDTEEGDEDDDEDFDEQNEKGDDSTTKEDSFNEKGDDNTTKEDSFNENSENPQKYEGLDEIFEPSEQLQILTSYLRSTYLYCIWCFTEYEDTDDLEKNCPGSTRSDHND